MWTVTKSSRKLHKPRQNWNSLNTYTWPFTVLNYGTRYNSTVYIDCICCVICSSILTVIYLSTSFLRYYEQVLLHNYIYIQALASEQENVCSSFTFCHNCLTWNEQYDKSVYCNSIFFFDNECQSFFNTMSVILSAISWRQHCLTSADSWYLLTRSEHTNSHYTTDAVFSSNVLIAYWIRTFGT